jgi:hypothetical protein
MQRRVGVTDPRVTSLAPAEQWGGGGGGGGEEEEEKKEDKRGERQRGREHGSNTNTVDTKAVTTSAATVLATSHHPTPSRPTGPEEGGGERKSVRERLSGTGRRPQGRVTWETCVTCVTWEDHDPHQRGKLRHQGQVHLLEEEEELIARSKHVFLLLVSIHRHTNTHTHTYTHRNIEYPIVSMRWPSLPTPPSAPMCQRQPHLPSGHQRPQPPRLALLSPLLPQPAALPSEVSSPSKVA